MAEFTDQDRELLDKLRKALENEGKTRIELEPWEEHISRDASVNAAKATLAAKVIDGFSGSWAAQYNYGYGSVIVSTGFDATLDNDPEGPPVPIRAKTSHIGFRGVPEINFAPYNWRTNTFGSKGPSLVGHPISFEVVGPTLKSPFTDWTWDIEQGAGGDGGDVLTPAQRPDGGGSALINDISDMYGPGSFDSGGGFWTIGDAAEPNGGLYVLITDDGSNPGSLDTAGGQVAMGALDFYADTARYELFRISNLGGTDIEIHPNKGFSRFFDLPASATRSVRAITIVRPYVTRLAAVPQSGAAGGNDGVSTSGREQTFVVLSPEVAASNDNYPPFDGGNGVASGDGSWIGGGFTSAREPNSGIAPGVAATYGGKVRLPVPIPVSETSGNVEQVGIAPAVPRTGTWGIETSSTTPFTTGLFSSRFPVVRVYTTARNKEENLFFGSTESVLGWYDVTALGGAFTGIEMTRVAETAPQTGLTYWGPGPLVVDAGLSRMDLGMNLHESVDTVWQGSFPLDKVEACRIQNLIDPSWVSRYEKQLSDPLFVGAQAAPLGGSSAGRPTNAIFDTRTFDAGGGIVEAANPGNLMDLGFQMVLFPAKPDPNDATQTIADFDRPIFGRELVIDGSLNEKQRFDVDYSAGLVRLSHPPPTSEGTTPDETTAVIPTGISGTNGNNPRAEVVLFGACVPYSMEDSQVGTGNRITAQDRDGRDVDVVSSQVSAAIDQTNTTFDPASPFIGISVLTGTRDIVLDRVWDGPETGVIDITEGSTDSPSFGRWGYTSISLVEIIPGERRTALSGISAIPSASDPTPAAPENPRTVVLRREVVFGIESLSLPSITDDYTGDTTYGSSARADVLRFRDAELEPNLDGSITVNPRTPGYMWNQQGQWASSGIFEPSTGGHRLSTSGILGGVFYQDSLDGTPTDSPSSGVIAVNPNGQYTNFDTVGLGESNGVVTQASRITVDHNFRLVIKFTLDADAVEDINQFIGLIGPPDLTGPPPGAPGRVQEAASSPPVPGLAYLGLRFDGPNPTAAANFFTQNPGSGASSTPVGPTGTPWSAFQNETHYLVIETTPYFDVEIAPPFPGGGAFVKMAVFDAEFNEIGRARFYNQVVVPFLTPMEVVIGSLNITSGGRQTVGLYNVAIVNNIDLPFLTIS